MSKRWPISCSTRWPARAELTEHASTFARPEVMVALGASLAGAGRMTRGGAGGPVLDGAGGQRGQRPGLGGTALVYAQLLAVEQRLVQRAGRTGEQAVASHEAVRDALVAHPRRNRPAGHGADLCRAAKASPSWSGELGRARPSPSASPAMPGWTATAPGRGADRDRHHEPAGRGFEDVATCDRLWVTWTAATSSWMPARCWWSMRPAWSVPASWAACSSTPTRPRPGGAGQG